ncbi:MAG: Fe-S cluster assembly protein HesB [Actinomycetota bacterium]|nr:Fe-S cluster assembly protein HesB [Actinomycetota bacterium]
MNERFELPLVGGGGEPVDLWRTIRSHGLVDLPPMRVDEAARTLELTVPVAGSRPRTLRVAYGSPGHAFVAALGPPVVQGEREALLGSVRHVLRLDEDLSRFYALAASDPALAWASAGAGRMIRSPTVFEEVVKTICTTNCAWSATERMVGALVGHLGDPAPGASPTSPSGRAFPTPEAMAETDESFYRDVMRAGYRGAYLRQLAGSVAEGSLDLEALGRASADELPDDQLAARLLALPGVGPYAAAHVMMLLGRYSRLVLDSWTRPKYARLTGGRTKADATIGRRFRRYGPYAGLAFWLFLTRDWVDEDVS